MKKQKHLIFSGVLILTLSNILVKAIGLLFKIPLQNLLGDEGMGYFNAAYSLYVWFYTLATAGLPVAVSILVSEDRAKGAGNVRRIFRTTMLLLCGIGLFCSSVLLLGASAFANLIDSPATEAAIRVIAPTVFCACLAGGVRGYFQGCGNMRPTAASQVIEALGKLILGIVFAQYALRMAYALPLVAAYAISGITVGSAGSALFLLIRKLLFDQTPLPAAQTERQSRRSVVHALCARAIPITISASVMSLTNLIDVMLVIRRLRATGLTEDAAQAIYGNYTTLAVPLFNLAPVLVYPIAYAMLPMLSEAVAKGDLARQKTLRDTALRTASILMMPCAIGLSVMARPVLLLLFSAPSAQAAAPLLSILALSMLFVGMLAITNTCLQAYHKERLPIYSMLTGAAVKLILSAVLIGIPSVGIYGSPLGTFACYLVIICLNFFFLYRTVGSLPSLYTLFFKPLFAACVCAFTARGAHLLLTAWLPSAPATLLALALAAGIYFLVLLSIGGVTPEEIRMLPKGEQVLHGCKKLGFFSEKNKQIQMEEL